MKTLLGLLLLLSAAAFALNTPTDVAAVVHDCTSVTLTWTDVNSGVPGIIYVIERTENSREDSWSLWGTVNGPATSFTDTRLTCGVTYWYRVTADQVSNKVMARTIPPAATPVPPPTPAQATE